MELALEAEIYCPSIDENQNYVDKIPPSIVQGLRCPCGSRRDKVYITAALFKEHIKRKHHQVWLNELNNNKTNYYKENEELKKTIQNQRIIISRLEKEISTKSNTINFLSNELALKSSNVVTDLLDLSY